MKKLPFQRGMVLMICAVILLVTGLTLGQVWLVSGKAAQETARQVFAEVAARTGGEVQAQIASALASVEIGAALSGIATGSGGGEADGPAPALLPVLRRVLSINPTFYATYIGQTDGSFLQLIAVRGKAVILAAHHAPDATAEILRRIDTDGAGRRVQHWSFLDETGQVLERRDDPDPAFTPSRRPWFQPAAESDSAILSAPYLFDSLKRLGLTVARRLEGEGRVLGLDITLDSIDTFLAGLRTVPGGGVMLLDRQGHLLAAAPEIKAGLPADMMLRPDAASPLLRLAAGLDLRHDLSPRISRLDGRDYIYQLSRWQGGGGEFLIFIAAPFDAFASPVRHMIRSIMLTSALLLAVLLPLACWLSRAMARTLGDLAADAERIREMDFSGEAPRHSLIAEFAALGEVLTMMKRTVLARTRDLEISQQKLRRQIEIGIAMNAESNSGKLIEIILREAKQLTNAEGGTLFVRTDDDQLRFQFLINDHLDIAIGGVEGEALELPTLPLRDPDSGAPILNHMVAGAVNQEKTIAIADITACEDFDFSEWRDFEKRIGYGIRSMLVVPLKPPNGPVIGAIQLINAREPGKELPVPFSAASRRFVEFLSSQAATALHNRALLDNQQSLVDAMVRIMSGAVDAKSPYTGEHSARVARLAVMIAEEASRIEEGPLAPFRLTTPEEWHELRIAAWLHDCGKVTTPEYVVDKATKLETIYNRIHEIRTRFEVLLRDAEIARWRAVAEGGAPAEAERLMEERRLRLMDDFAFIADCNIGSEYMAPDKVERLGRIAATPWLRHFDDRLGLSHEELDRASRQPARPLPAWESLLADRPEQVIPWTEQEAQRHRQWDFATRIPEHMYNRGEIYNLRIPRGTLTEEERFKINEHAIQTILMLEALPFPAHLRRVAEYACAHHEALDGRGYPRGLTAAQMSVPARIMALADVFEALTSADRPYKKAKNLSEAITILSGFRDRHHLDPDIFDLFLKSGLYRRYAEEFLDPKQIDVVDVGRFLRKIPASA